MRFLYYLVLGVILVSCKSKTALVEKSNATSSEDVKSRNLIAEKIIQNQQNNHYDFKTLYIKSSANYKDDKTSQRVSAEIKIKKDQMILVSIRFLGITMAKALITPNEVQYYEKLNGTYFQGNYETLSKWLGSDLDYDKLQNILTGQPLKKIKTDNNFSIQLNQNVYELVNNPDANTLISFFFNAENLEFKKQQIVQIEQNRNLQISYPDYKKIGEMNLPLSLVIEAGKENTLTNINIEYNSITVNEDLSFPYSVPEGYQRISIN